MAQIPAPEPVAPAYGELVDALRDAHWALASAADALWHSQGGPNTHSEVAARNAHHRTREVLARVPKVLPGAG